MGALVPTIDVEDRADNEAIRDILRHLLVA